MGMFDTIEFEAPLPCGHCGKPVSSTQTKEFDSLMNRYRIKDCVSHAEDIRIAKEDLWCEDCKEMTSPVYLVVNRGVLVGVTPSFEEAQRILRYMNYEKLVLWYHDLWKRLTKAAGEARRSRRFIEECAQWFEEGRHLEEVKVGEKKPLRLGFFGALSYVEGAKNPLEALRRYLKENPAPEDEASDSLFD